MSAQDRKTDRYKTTPLLPENKQIRGWDGEAAAKDAARFAETEDEVESLALDAKTQDATHKLGRLREMGEAGFEGGPNAGDAVEEEAKVSDEAPVEC